MPRAAEVQFVRGKGVLNVLYNTAQKIVVCSQTVVNAKSQQSDLRDPPILAQCRLVLVDWVNREFTISYQISLWLEMSLIT